MIDPDNIQIQNSYLPAEINIKQVADFEYSTYNLDDDKDFKKFLKDVESQVRRSFEYQEFIKYLRENMNMNRCSFLKDVTNLDTFAIKIELHHYPFSLADICQIVYNKRSYYNESLELQMVAKEVMQLHYKLLVGLIPLSETVHEVYHSGRLFIPTDAVIGRYRLFIDLYKPFIDPQLLDSINRAEKYTMEKATVMDTTIIEQNKVHYRVTDSRFLLPDINKIDDNMIQQIELIKNNNYMLPNIDERPLIEEKRKEVIHPIHFDKNLIKNKGGD